MKVRLGTLVIAIPTLHGLVVAADSRASNELQTKFCDDDYKLIELEAPAHSLATVTGMSGAHVPRDDEADYCKFLKQREEIIDLKSLLKQHLEERAATARTLDSNELISDTLFPAFKALKEEYKSIISPLAPTLKANLVVFSFEPESGRSLIRAVVVGLSQSLSQKLCTKRCLMWDWMTSGHYIELERMNTLRRM